MTHAMSSAKNIVGFECGIHMGPPVVHIVHNHVSSGELLSTALMHAEEFAEPGRSFLLGVQSALDRVASVEPTSPLLFRGNQDNPLAPMMDFVANMARARAAIEPADLPAWEARRKHLRALANGSQSVGVNAQAPEAAAQRAKAGGVDLDALMRELGESSVGDNPLELFRLCILAQRALVAVLELNAPAQAASTNQENEGSAA